MSSRIINKILLYTVSLVIIILIGIITTTISSNNSTYYNKTKKYNNTIINYPYFNQKQVDKEISNYIDNLPNKQFDEIKYKINNVDDYHSILFTKYLNRKVIGYDYLIIDPNNKVNDISAIISDELILKEKVKIYLEQNHITINNNDKQKYNYLLDEKDLIIIIESNDNGSKVFTTININYQEIEEILKIKYEIDKTYIAKLTTTTTTKPPVEDKNDEKESNNGNKIIAFTFDDGPSKYTTEILDILDKYDAKATFFEVGYNIRNYRSVVTEVVNRGFEVGNHTTDHSNLNKLSVEKIKSKVYDNNDLFKEITGKDFPLLRPPYGNCKQKVKEVIDVPIIIWSVDSRDWESRNTEKIVNLVKKETKSGDIVLFHDLYPTTLEAIKILVPYYYEQGYKIVSVSELYKLNNKELKPGTKYYRIEND